MTNSQLQHSAWLHSRHEGWSELHGPLWQEQQYLLVTVFILLFCWLLRSRSSVLSGADRFLLPSLLKNGENDCDKLAPVNPGVQGMCSSGGGSGLSQSSSPLFCTLSSRNSFLALFCSTYIHSSMLFLSSCSKCSAMWSNRSSHAAVRIWAYIR